jgi:hypothetical protein
MYSNSVKTSESNQIFFYSIIIAIIFFMFVMPVIESYQIKERKVLKEKMENIF